MTDSNKKMRVHADQDVCVGAGMCVLNAAGVFDQRDADGVVVVKTVEPSADLYDSVEDAAAQCPSKAITIEYVAKT